MARRCQPSTQTPFSVAGRFKSLGLLVLIAFLILGSSAKAVEEENRWTIRLEPMLVAVSGHDRPILNQGTMTANQLEVLDTAEMTVEEAFTLRGEVLFETATWGFGADVFVCFTSHEAASELSLGEAGAAFEIPERVFVSTDSSDELFYEPLGDTDLEVWTMDFFAQRSLKNGDRGRWDLRFGLRLGDFDNDYHAVAGITGERGTQLDASSNYELMFGPMVALAGRVHRGKNRLEGALVQSIIFGSAELSRSLGDFQGSFPPEGLEATSSVRRQEDAEIPITDLRLRWTYRLSQHWSAGLGAEASIWWSVPVPPGVEPGGPLFQENTITFYGLMAIVELGF